MIHLLWGLPALLVVGAFGWVVARSVVREQDALVAGGFALGAGMGGLALVLNLWLHVGTGFNGACALGACTLAGAACLTRRLPKAPPLVRPPGPWPWILLGIAAFLLFYVPALVRLDIHDVFEHHAPIALSYQRDRFPTEYPYFPFEPYVYHYYADLVGAALSRMLAVSVYTSLKLVTLVGGLVLYASVFALARRLTTRVGLAHLAAAFALAGGGLSWLLLFTADAAHWWRDGFYPAIRAGDQMDLMRIPLLLDIFYQKSTSFGLPLFLMGVLWCDRAITSGARPLMAAAGLVVGCLDLGHAVLFLLLCCGLVFRAGLGARRRWTFPAESRRALVILAMALGAAMLGGGLLARGRPGTGMVFAPHVHLADGAASGAIVVWRYLETFGIPLLLFPVAVWLAWTRRNDLAVFLGAMAFGGLLVPHLFAYRGGWEASRYFALKFLPFSVQMMAWLLPLVFDRILVAGHQGTRRAVVVALLLATALAPAVLAVNFAAISTRIARPGYPDSAAEERAARYLAPRVLSDEMVLTPSTGLARYAGLRTPILTENIVHSGFEPRRLAEVERLLGDLYDRLPDEVLLAWRVRYLCLSPEDFGRLGPVARARLASGAFVREEEFREAGETRIVYRFLAIPAWTPRSQ